MKNLVQKWVAPALAVAIGIGVAPPGMAQSGSPDIDFCLRGAQAIVAFPASQWETCGAVPVSETQPPDPACQPVPLVKGATSFSVAFDGANAYLSVDRRGTYDDVTNALLTPATNAGDAVVYYSVQAKGVDYYVYQKAAPANGKGAWFMDLFQATEANAVCNGHRPNSPGQIVAGACPTKKGTVPPGLKQGATGGGGGNKPAQPYPGDCPP